LRLRSTRDVPAPLLARLRVCAMTRLPSLERHRFVIGAVDWTSQAVRTGGPSGPLRDERVLTVRFDCEVPFRAAAFMDSKTIRFYARDWARHSEPVAELGVHFRPYDWDLTDDVQIMAAGRIRAAVESASLKTDPVGATIVQVAPGDVGYTGDPLTVLTIPEIGASMGVLLVRSTDTKGDRTRWRVRDDHAGDLGDFSFLSTGRRSGWTPYRLEATSAHRA
jgi:hypothetical protein